MSDRQKISRLLELLRRRLGGSGSPGMSRGQKVAAVLVPIFERGDEGHLLFIKRSEQVSHQGQVAFPGGRAEPADRDLSQTALREAYEEVGIEPNTVDLLGFLPVRDTRVSGYTVAPFVGLIPDPQSLRHDPIEVAEVFTVPIRALSDARYRGSYEFRRDGGAPSSHPAILYHGQAIWGLTYRITRDLLEMLEAPGD